MSAAPNTVFLRLEGPLQAWGDNSKFVIRRTMDAPTKSGVVGLICCAMGLPRQKARDELPNLNELVMGVRIDRPGTRWWDYHTVGAKVGLLTAQGKLKRTASTGEIETLVSRREYLCDASFLVALQGDADVVRRVRGALANPRWPVFLGRKSCPPSAPILAGEAQCDDVGGALRHHPWRPRHADDKEAKAKEICVPCVIEWRASEDQPAAPAEAEVWYDRAVSFDPPVHEPRLVMRGSVTVEVGSALQRRTPPPPRPRANYQNTDYKKARAARLEADQGLCVFCKSPATTVQHTTYRRAGGHESQDDLRSLCRLCHDAVTMIEYGLGMGLDRINPEDPQWRERIIEKRDEIMRWRSVQARRRALRGVPEPVRQELLEEQEA